MLLDLRVWQWGLPVEKVIMDIGAIKMVVAVQIIKLVQNGMRLIHSIFSKNNPGFLHKME